MRQVASRRGWPTAVAFAALLGGLVGCQSEKAPAQGAATGLPRLTEVERTRSSEACDDYVRALCACARTKPELQPTCDLDVSLQQGVATMLRVEAAVTEPEKIKMAQHQLQRMTETCVERRAQLAAKGCP